MRHAALEISSIDKWNMNGFYVRNRTDSVGWMTFLFGRSLGLQAGRAVPRTTGCGF